MYLLTVFADVWSDKKRKPKSPLDLKTFNSNVNKMKQVSE